MDIQVYSSKEKASVTVNDEVVSNFRNGVRLYLQYKKTFFVKSWPSAKQTGDKSTVKTKIHIFIQYIPRKAVNKVN